MCVCLRVSESESVCERVFTTERERVCGIERENQCGRGGVSERVCKSE